MGIYITKSKENKRLQDDTSSLSTFDAPYLMLISGNLFVSSPSTQVTIEIPHKDVIFMHTFRIPHES